MPNNHAFTGPPQYPVAIILRHRPTDPGRHPSGDRWQITGVIVSSQPAPTVLELKARSSPEGDHYLWSGFSIRLYPDEVESYGSNLRSDYPNLFVICYPNAQGIPVPSCMTASFAKAHAYPDALIEAVPLPPELYPWVESYVLAHDAPERRTRRAQNRRLEQNHESV